MVESSLTYEDYTFVYNPKTLKIKADRTLKIYTTPAKTYYSQDLGCTPTVVTGEGIFTGDYSMFDYVTLYNLFLSTPLGSLKLPYLTGNDFYFTSLEILCQGEDNSITYSFEFVEA